MDVMSDPVAWLREAMDHVERVARAALPEMGDPAVWPDYTTYGVGEAVTEHLQIHGPTPALARMEADREILARHLWRPGDRELNGEPACPTCATAFGLILWPCPTFLAVLAAYRHVPVPGFREEWIA